MTFVISVQWRIDLVPKEDKPTFKSCLSFAWVIGLLKHIRRL
jgi:hypothetical protein